MNVDECLAKNDMMLQYDDGDYTVFLKKDIFTNTQTFTSTNLSDLLPVVAQISPIFIYVRHDPTRHSYMIKRNGNGEYHKVDFKTLTSWV